MCVCWSKGERKRGVLAAIGRQVLPWPAPPINFPAPTHPPPPSFQCSIHLAVCLAGGRLLNLPPAAVLIASNANVGGPATAAAMASSKGWHHLIQPAMLTGSLGYALATAIGCWMGAWMRNWHMLAAAAV